MAERIFTQTFGVVGAILEHDGKILLVKEAGGYAKGQWSHPAGWIDVGEDPVAAVKREVVEESGYEFTPTRLLGVYSLVINRAGTKRQAIKIIYTGSIRNLDSPRKLEDDVSGTKWFLPEEIAAMDGHTLRDMDIKHMVKDYFAGKGTSLGLLTHTEQAA